MDLTAQGVHMPQQQQQKQTPVPFSDIIKSKVSNILKGKVGDDFVVAVISLLNQNPALATCDHTSIVSSTLQAHSLGLSFNTMLGQAYFVPFKQKEKKNAKGEIVTPERTLLTMQVGYKGYLQLAMRSGQYKKINVLAIKEGELDFYDPLNEEIHVNLIQDDVLREETPTIGYYAMFEYTNGFRKCLYWSKAKMATHADRYSQAFSLNAKGGKHPKVSFADFEAGKYPERDAWLYSSFWYKDFDGMAYKTMLRQLISKWGIMSVEMQKAYESDMQAFDDNGVTGEVVDTDFIDVSPAQDETKQQNVITQNSDSKPSEPSEPAEPTTQQAKEELAKLRAHAIQMYELSGVPSRYSCSPEKWGTAQCKQMIADAEAALRDAEQRGREHAQ